MQLDLFDQTTEAEVLAFPLERQGQLVREIAAGLLERDLAEGERYWLRRQSAERARLRQLGLAASCVDDAISELARAVRREITVELYRLADGC